MATYTFRDLSVLPIVLASVSGRQWLLLAGAIFLMHTLIKFIYNAFFHPLSVYPGPKLASVSEIWSAFHLATGRWPWALESAIEKYGDIVRTGPDSLVFLNPQAVQDIHGAKRDLNDTFIKTPMVDGLGDEDDGLLWERNPEKHRRVSKTMSSAFSGKSLRAKIPTMNRYIDSFIMRMKEYGDNEEGVDLSTWLGWLCMDTAADLACNWEMHQVRDMKNHPFLDSMEAANFLMVVIVTVKTYPILAPMAFLVVPWKTMRSIPRMIRQMRAHTVQRLQLPAASRHSDYFEILLPDTKAPDMSDKRVRHMLTVAGQLILGGYDPTSVAIYMGFFHLIHNHEALEQLQEEVRSTFSSYEEINPEILRTLPWLNACMQETFRLSASATHHSLPRLSPGGVVNGDYIPKGVLCRNSLFTYSRSERFFHNAKSFKPQRWLPPDHSKYDPAFAADDQSAHYPFIMGPRQCPGREVARIMFRLVVAKMFWLFDAEHVSRKMDFEKDFTVYAMWNKPELRVRLSLGARGSGKT